MPHFTKRNFKKIKSCIFQFLRLETIFTNSSILRQKICSLNRKSARKCCAFSKPFDAFIGQRCHAFSGLKNKSCIRHKASLNISFMPFVSFIWLNPLFFKQNCIILMSLAPRHLQRINRLQRQCLPAAMSLYNKGPRFKESTETRG